MSIITLDTIVIATHWLPALINSDPTNLTDEEEEQLDEWFKALCDTHGCSVYISLDSRADTTDFARDDISGLMADCETVILYN